MNKALKNILESLDLFSCFLDRIEKYNYIVPHFALSSYYYKNAFYWSISKLGVVDVIEPYQFFFGEAYKNKSKNKLYITSQPGKLPDEIEEFYKVVLIKEFPNYDPYAWNKKRFLEEVKKRYSMAFNTLEMMEKMAKEFRRKEGLNIKVIIDPDGEYYFKITYDTKNLDIKKEIDMVFEGIEVLRRIYQLMYNVEDRDQRIIIGTFMDELNLLRTYIYATRDFIRKLRDIQIYSIGIRNIPYVHGRDIWIRAKSKEIELIDIVVLETEDQIKNYSLTMRIVPQKEKYSKYLEKLSLFKVDTLPSHNIIGIEVGTETLLSAFKQAENILKTLIP